MNNNSVAANLEAAEIIKLSIPDQEHFAQALLSPPNANPALERAFTIHDKLVIDPMISKAK